VSGLGLEQLVALTYATDALRRQVNDLRASGRADQAELLDVQLRILDELTHSRAG